MDTLKAVKLALLYTGSGFRPDIGATGSPIEVSAAKVIHRGSGTLYFKDGDDGTDEIIIDSPNTLLAAALDGAAITMISAIRGAVQGIGTLGAVAMLRVSHNAKVAWNAGAGAIAKAICSGGVVTCSAVVTALLQAGGNWTQAIEEIVTWDGGGGTLVYNSPTATGTMTNAYHTARATLILTGTTDIKTITNYYGEPGANLLRDEDLHKITNEYDLTLWLRDHGTAAIPSS